MANATKEKSKAAKKTQGATPRATDIPLDNIPERKKWTLHSDEFKREVAARIINGEGLQAVAEDTGLSRSMIAKWAQRVREGRPLTDRGGEKKNAVHPGDNAGDIAVALRQSLERAMKARDDRLEAAASIVEADGGGADGAQMAKKIRAWIRHKPPML